MSNFLYDKWKRDFWKRMYGGHGSSDWGDLNRARAMNVHIQGVAADLEEKLMVKELSKPRQRGRCYHGFALNGMFCETCIKARSAYELEDIPISVDGVVAIDRPIKVKFDGSFDDITLKRLQPGRIVEAVDNDCGMVGKPSKEVEALLPYKLAVDELITPEASLNIINDHLGNLTKEQLDEVYKKLHNSYGCRIYK